MKDLKFWEVEALVKFMYKGEVNIPHDKLPQLLKAAEALDVKGLANFAPVQIQTLPTVIPHLARQTISQTINQTNTQINRQTSNQTINQTSSQINRQTSNQINRPTSSQINRQTTSQTNRQTFASAPPKPTEAKNPKKNPTNLSSSSQSSAKRGIKRPIESKKATLVSKYRRERPATPPPLRTISPEIKMETLDIPLGDTDIFPVTDVHTLDEANDSGGEHLHGSPDMDDVQEHMDLVLTDLLQRETHFLEGMNTEVIRSTNIADIGDSNEIIISPSDDQDYGKSDTEDGT